jgi:hypothetical protein
LVSPYVDTNPVLLPETPGLTAVKIQIAVFYVR